jgi:hypothetical protein
LGEILRSPKTTNGVVFRTHLTSWGNAARKALDAARRLDARSLGIPGAATRGVSRDRSSFKFCFVVRLTFYQHIHHFLSKHSSLFINTFITFPFLDSPRQNKTTCLGHYLDCCIAFSLVAAATAAAQVTVRIEKCHESA